MRRRIAAAAAVLALALALTATACGGKKSAKVNRPAVESQEQQFQAPNEGDPIAIFHTSKGEIRAVLYPDDAPMAVENFTGLVERLIRSDVLAGEDPGIMAAQLCLPISAWINLCDREPEREAEVMELVGRHIAQFFRLYRK